MRHAVKHVWHADCRYETQSAAAAQAQALEATK
jgi:hypothetical protein